MDNSKYCILSNCNNIIVTHDGYCKYHKAWSQDDSIVSEFLRKHLNKVYKARCKKTRLKNFYNLLKFISYKTDFIKNKDDFKKVFINKLEEIDTIDDDNQIETKVIINELKKIKIKILEKID